MSSPPDEAWMWTLCSREKAHNEQDCPRSTSQWVPRTSSSLIESAFDGVNFTVAATLSVGPDELDGPLELFG